MGETKYDGEWELVNSSGSAIRQFRQKVPGGWLVVMQLEDQMSSTFLPDQDHGWDPPIKQGRKGGGFYD